VFALFGSQFETCGGIAEALNVDTSLIYQIAEELEDEDLLDREGLDFDDGEYDVKFTVRAGATPPPWVGVVVQAPPPPPTLNQRVFKAFGNDGPCTCSVVAPALFLGVSKVRAVADLLVNTGKLVRVDAEEEETKGEDDGTVFDVVDGATPPPGDDHSMGVVAEPRRAPWDSSLTPTHSDFATNKYYEKKLLKLLAEVEQDAEAEEGDVEPGMTRKPGAPGSPRVDSREKLVEEKRAKEAEEKKAPPSATKPSKKRRKGRADDEESTSDDGEDEEDEEDEDGDVPWRPGLGI